jgi:protein-tyrosine phosphatase
VLAGIDDGARDLTTTREMLHLLATVGFSEVCATPHQKAAQFMPSAEQIAAAYADAQRLCESGGPRLLLGAENYWDDVFFARARERTIPCYTGGKAFLVEISPLLMPPRFEEQLFTQRSRGLLPVLAHPERYAELDLGRAADVGRIAALVVDLGALEGAHGAREAKAARRLVLEGVAHACASDVHGPQDVQAAAAGIAWIRKKLGEDAVTRLLEDNPRRILGGDLPEAL